jgi:hypothetical protein
MVYFYFYLFVAFHLLPRLLQFLFSFCFFVKYDNRILFNYNFSGTPQVANEVSEALCDEVLSQRSKFQGNKEKNCTNN